LAGMKKKNILETFLYSAVGVAAMFIIVAAVYLICGVVRARVDLTQEKLYTLSAGTKKILAKLDTPVEIRFYASQHVKEMPVLLKTYAQRVEDFLNEYRKAAPGKIIIKKLDPEPDSDAEESATFDGVQGQLVSLGEKVYLGLAISQLDAKVAIPFLSPERERLLEYDLTRAISAVTTTTKPVIGVMSPLPVFGQPSNPFMARMGQSGQEPWIFVSELKRDFDVRQVEMTAAEIPGEINVLLVVHPKEITEAAQYAIDQFVLRGGKLIAFVDPFMIVDQSAQQNPMMPNMPAPSSLDKLFKAWGIQFENTKVIADMNFAKEISLQRGAPPQLQPCFLFLDTKGINTDDPLTSQIDSLWMPFAGVFKGTPAEGLTETVLLKTSTQSQPVDGFMAQLSGANVVKDFQASGTSLPLAVRLKGKFKTAFPEGKPKAAADEKKEEKKDEKKEEKPAADNSLKESKGENMVLLVGDADMLFDQFLVRIQEVFGQRILIPQRNSNLSLVQNMVEQMAGDSNLIAIRSRATMSRPFTVVQEMQAKAEQGYQSKIKELEKSLSDTQSRLTELQRQRGNEETGQKFILSAEQQNEIKNFQKKEAEVKRELKDVRKNLRRDIDSLETRLKWANIGAMPLLVTLSGIALALFKRKRTAAK